MRKCFDVPDKCQYCSKVNFKIFGGVYREPTETYKLTVRCMTCGKIVFNDTE